MIRGFLFVGTHIGLFIKMNAILEGPATLFKLRIVDGTPRLKASIPMIVHAHYISGMKCSITRAEHT